MGMRMHAYLPVHRLPLQLPVLLQLLTLATLVRVAKCDDNTTTTNNNETDTKGEEHNNTPELVLDEALNQRVLLTTLSIYAPLFVLLVLVFCFVRQRHPQVYNVRAVVPRLHSPMTAAANSQHGFFGWIWKLRAHTDQELLEHCSLDAVCVLRIVRLGRILSLVGVFCSLFLIPVYETAPSSSSIPTAAAEDGAFNETITEQGEEFWIKSTTTFLPKRSNRFLAPVAAAYVFFGCFMVLILKELEWFTRKREAFLTKKTAQSYTVCVSAIPKQYQSNHALLQFFRRAVSEEAVFSAALMLKIPRLQAATNQKTLIQLNLERAQAMKDDGVVALVMKNMNSLSLGPTSFVRVPAIAHYKKLLEEQDLKILRLRQIVERKLQLSNNLPGAVSTQHPSPMPIPLEDIATHKNVKLNGSDELCILRSDGHDDSRRLVELLGREELIHSSLEDDSLMQHRTSGLSEGRSQNEELDISVGMDDLSDLMYNDTNRYKVIEDVVSKVAKNVLKGSSDEDEGQPLNVGFVTFSRLSAVAVALQVIQSKIPYQLIVSRAPSPEEILWGNVGLSHRAIQTGYVLAFAATATLCIFWTVPVAFLVSLTEVNSLKENTKYVQRWIEASPWLESSLNQISPLLLQLINVVVLPQILKAISWMEGAAGLSLLEASLFTKLAAFQIFQSFVVASVTGSITSKLSRLDEFGDILRYLARTLPPQAVFFIQLIMISTTIGLGTEMLRTTALIQSTLRKRVGPRATDRERGLPFLGLRPLCNPRNFLYAKVLANQSLFFMLLFTFVTLSPLICYVLLFSFSMFEIGYRHQFIHVYPPTPDSGGQMWITFLDILLISSVIAELLLFTVTSLADTNVAVFLMIPLIVATILFNVYVRQRHFSVLRNLSAETCVEVDDTRILEEPLNNESSHDWLKDKYLQPALHPEEKRVDLNTQSLGMVHG